MTELDDACRRLVELARQSHSDDFGALDGVARALCDTGEYRTLRRFRPRPRYCDSPAPTDVRRAIYVDVETNGLDTTANKIIEFAAVPFEFDTTGLIYAVHEPVSYLEDPGEPIPDDIRELTGITNEMVQGQRIDEAAVENLLATATLIIAHNAEFDRRVLERRLPRFADMYWACSQRDVDWPKLGYRGTRLDYLLFNVCGEFHEAHRAVDDCLAGIRVLASASPDRRNILAHLLDHARQPTIRLWALQAPYELKEQLKARRYRWSDGSDGRPRSWYRDVTPDQQETEEAWLRQVAYGGAERAPFRVTQYTARERYSARV